jgi:hypothetical protein
MSVNHSAVDPFPHRGLQIGVVQRLGEDADETLVIEPLVRGYADPAVQIG